MDNKKDKTKQQHPVISNIPTSRLEGDLPNKEKGIREMYSKDSFTK